MNIRRPPCGPLARYSFSCKILKVRKHAYQPNQPRPSPHVKVSLYALNTKTQLSTAGLAAGRSMRLLISPQQLRVSLRP